MKNKLTILTVVLLSNSVFSQINPVWTNTYNGVGDFSDKWNAIELDNAGNIYLTGSAMITGNNTDVITAKTNSNGDTLWVRTLDGGNNSGDKGSAIKVDASGNVYVVGTINRSNTEDDIITIKYNSLGDTLWTKTYNNSIVNQDETGVSLAIDASGNVYVTGNSDGDNTAAVNDDYVTIMYNSNGVQQWFQAYDGTGNLGDIPVGLGIDNNGNVYVSGKSFNGGDDDYVTIKYNSLGIQTWLQTYNGGGNDRPAAMQTDAIGTTYVTGRSKTANDDYYTIAYNASGSILWTATYAGAAAGHDRPIALTYDSNGNIYVTGQSAVVVTPSSTNYDYLTVKYDLTGNQLWAKNYNGLGNNNDIPSDITVDVNGNVYVTGKADNDASVITNNDYATVQYNSAGVQQWVKIYNGSANMSDGANAIAVDGLGNSVITGGSIQNTSQKNATTIKYNATGTQQWIKNHNAIGDNSDNGSAIAADASGNVYVAGYTFGNGTDRDICVMKINSTGDTAWVRKFDGSAGKTDQAAAIAVDASGAVYITGYSKNTASGYDYITIKYNSIGDTLWTKLYNGLGNGTDKATALILDGAGNVYISGYSDSNPSLASNDNYVTIKYNSTGVQLWASSFNGTANGADRASGIVVDASGNVFVTGKSFNGTDYDLVTLKYNSTGVQQNSTTYSGGYGDDSPNAITIDANSNIYLTGQTVATNLFDDCITLKYNSSLTQTWAQTFNGTGNKNDRAYAIAIDGVGNVYVTGESDSTTSILEKNYDYVTIKYSSAGVQQWAKTYNGQANTDDVAFAIALDGLGNIFVTGQSENGTSTFPKKDCATIKYDNGGNLQSTSIYNGTDNGTDGANAMVIDNVGNVYVTGSSFSTTGQKDIVTIKYSFPVGIEEQLKNQPKVAVYPNPFNSQAIISIAMENTLPGWTLNVYDALGKKVISQNIKNTNQTIISKNNLPNGLYFYQAIDKTKVLGSGNFIIVD